MLKYICNIIYVLIPFTIFAQKQSFFIKENEYILKYIYEKNNIGGSKYKKLELYRNNKYLLSHPIYKSFEDSHYQEVEKGKMIVSTNRDSIIFYTLWSYKGQDNASKWGARKQIYLTKNQQLKPYKAIIYIEEGLPNDGKLFLQSKPTNLEEQKIFEQYINMIQHKYKATFLFGINADQLLHETRKIINNSTFKGVEIK